MTNQALASGYAEERSEPHPTLHQSWRRDPYPEDSIYDCLSDKPNCKYTAQTFSQRETKFVILQFVFAILLFYAEFITKRLNNGAYALMLPVLGTDTRAKLNA